MPTIQPDAVKDVSVEFDREFGQITIKPSIVTVANQNIDQINLTLATTGNGTGAAKFSACPIIFDGGGPTGVQTRRTSDTQVTMTVPNTVQGQNNFSHSYRLEIDFNGTVFFSDDPHIINLGEPPV